MYAIDIFLILPFKLLYWSVIPPFSWLVRIFLWKIVSQNALWKFLLHICTFVLLLSSVSEVAKWYLWSVCWRWKYAKNYLRLLFFIAQEIDLEDLVEFLHLHFAVWFRFATWLHFALCIWQICYTWPFANMQFSNSKS